MKSPKSPIIFQDEFLEFPKKIYKKVTKTRIARACNISVNPIE